MPTLTYLLINTENMGHATPMAVSGYSGKLYGHAEFDAKEGAHVFRVPDEDGIRCPDGSAAKWDGDMDLDIAKGMHRRLQRWKIRAEVAETPNSALESLRDAAVAHVGEIEEIPPFSSVVPLMEQLPPVGDRALDDAIGAFSQAASKAGLVTLPDLNIHPMKLEKMVRDANEKGANIVIEGERTKVKLRAALLEHFSKSQAA